MKCENCGKEHNGSYGSGRFCSQKCARSFSTNKNRNQINKKISSTAKNNLIKCPYCFKYFNSYGYITHNKFCELNPDRNINLMKNEDKRNETIQKNLNKQVIARDGTKLNCTYLQINQYKSSHNKCEICGKTVEESIKYSGKYKSKNLCIDHDHTNNKFRGLLCQVCNRQLGWYENNKENIHEYLNKKYPFD